ncbi:uncharacterized protein G2W53_006602 [Senna tora]|uniref:Uncharacterized protein n=1 Tax=Senna tora TaxID=362788 RepID=A0A834X5D3_9FABA|nr:uncharacterized protein G2W53_006602 [Senna tora]
MFCREVELALQERKAKKRLWVESKWRRRMKRSGVWRERKDGKPWRKMMAEA